MSRTQQVHGEDEIEAIDGRGRRAGTTSGPSLAAAPTSWASTPHGGWRWDGSSSSSYSSLRTRGGGDMSSVKTTYDDPALAGKAIARDQARELLGQVMGYVAVAVGFAALGAYLGRDLSGATGLVLFIGAFACIFALNIAAAKGREQLAIGLLFGLGLVLGLAVAPVIADYAKADPSALWQAAVATAAFVAALGAYGYATRRDLSAWARTLFWALLGLIAFGIAAIFVSIPNGHIIYAVAGLGIFGAFTIFDFNRLRRASSDSAIAIAASIFLDIFNVFLLLLELFGGSRE
jgi:FtsH-binding integral membrane protein